MSLKGQNFRIFVNDPVIGMVVVAKATSCTVNLTTNTEDRSTKDDVGLAAKPVVLMHGWNVQVDALDVMDMGALLTQIKSLQPLAIAWDETDTSDNRTPEQATYSRGGSAYLSDATFVLNDREICSKSMQFTGTSELAPVQLESIVGPLGSLAEGQYTRLFLSADNTATPVAVIASAKQLQFHVSVQLEQSSTKDTEGNYEVYEPTGLTYDITSNALMSGSDTITSLVGGKTVSDVESIKEGGVPVKWQICNVNGANQRTKVSVIVSGSAVITNLTLNGPNRQNADYNTTLTGYGEYTVGS